MLVRRKGTVLVGHAAIFIGSACGGRAPLQTGYFDGGVPEDAAMTVQFSDTDRLAPPASLAGGSGDSAISPPMQTVDAMPPMQTVDAADAMAAEAGPVLCKRSGGGAVGTAACTVTYGEICGETNYQISCSCPRGSCVCFGPTTHVVDYMECPSCGFGPNRDPATRQAITDRVFAACGFP
jgi:hypothetical protein